MSNKTYYYVCTFVFLILALLHMARVAFDWQAIVDGYEVPLWTSWASLAICLYLAGRGYILIKKLKKRRAR